METNKFATMLHRNTNKITIILTYAILEWILIILLLLNSLFSHLITRFAVYFGLKKPCLWCSRADRYFGNGNSKNTFQDLVCEHHANEISQLGYCSTHNNLARNQYMCKDCSSFSQPFSPRSSGNIDQKIGNGELNSKCSCCDVSLSIDLYPPYLLYREDKNRVAEEEEDHGIEKSHWISQCKEIEIDEDDLADSNETTERESIKVHAPDSPITGMDILQSNSTLKLENWSNFDDHFLVTIESIDSLRLNKGTFSIASKVETIENLVEDEENKCPECNTESAHIPSEQAPLIQTEQLMPFDDDMFEAIEIVINDSDELIGIEPPKTSTEKEMFKSHQQLINQSQLHDPIPKISRQEDISSRSYNDAGEDQSPEKAEEENIIHHLSENSKDNATEMEDQHNKSSLEKKPGMEESTIEHLKLVLKEERKARRALLEELEEERNANEVAAKQTMEMITRLQEEKETVQMEALQYQRMMDEQSEYDQEALQLLNELVVKVEKEKNELQTELEISRKKIIHYEAKERRRMKRKTSFSNSEDSDQLQVDFEHGSVDGESCNGHVDSSNHTPANGFTNVEDLDLESSKHMRILDESLADFEAEKLSILEKLKELEEKLFTLSDEEGEHFEDIKPVELFPDEDLIGQEVNNNGHMSQDTNGDTKEHSTPVVSHNKSSISKFMEVNKRLEIEEEVDNVYERLQALEADREFLKQSISSLKKGEKGMDLLREILQYLRDLRNVELSSTRKMSDASLS